MGVSRWVKAFIDTEAGGGRGFVAGRAAVALRYFCFYITVIEKMVREKMMQEIMRLLKKLKKKVMASYKPNGYCIYYYFFLDNRRRKTEALDFGYVSQCRILILTINMKLSLVCCCRSLAVYYA